MITGRMNALWRLMAMRQSGRLSVNANFSELDAYVNDFL